MTALDTRGSYRFFALACAITWSLDAPMALAMHRHQTPSPLALGLTGLGAFGPTLAALLLAAPRRELGEVFGRWRTHPGWVLGALLVPGALHFAANVLDLALGGHPARWFYPPTRPEYVAAMVFFSFGEEFGWRGFAYPRLVARYGLLVGCTILGLVWAGWHLLMLVSPASGTVDLRMLGIHAVDLVLYSLVFAWFFERSGRSMAVAIALHAGGHLDNPYRAATIEPRLQLLRVLVLAIAATCAVRALRTRASGERAA